MGMVCCSMHGYIVYTDIVYGYILYGYNNYVIWINMDIILCCSMDIVWNVVWI